MAMDSLRKRYLYKVSSNIIGQALSFVTYTIIPRGLGPGAYGNFNFLNNFFMQVINFLEMGTSSAFYTKISHRQKEFGLVSFYLYFTGAVSLVALSVALFAFSGAVRTKFWPGQAAPYIFLAAGLAIVTWFAQLLNNMTDAYGLTVYSERATIAQKVFGVILISALYVSGRLWLGSFFLYQYLIFGFLIAMFVWIMEKKSHSFIEGWRLTLAQTKKYVNEFYKFSHPLFIYGLVGLIVGLFDRWILQICGGSIQQGFFGLAFQIGAFCFLFSGAMTPLLLREFSISFGNNDIKSMATLFTRHIPLLYSIAAYFSCFIVAQADKAIYIVGGNRFKEAGLVLAIMALYPIHRTYGQLSGSVFFATGKTRLYRNLGITFMLLGLPLTYFFIAPRERFGLAAGAGGLATKMVLLQFIEVNAQLYFNSKFLGIPFWKQIAHQLLSVGGLLSAALIARFAVSHISATNIFIDFLAAGALYTVFVIITAYFFPELFGLKEGDIALVKKWFMQNRNKT